MSAIERSTRQRDAIKSVIDAAKRPLSPCEVPEAARKRVRALGIATVYRNLKWLRADGECTTCRRVYDAAGCPGNLRRLAPRGFRVDHHDVTLYGRCLDCGKRKIRAAR